MSVNAITRTFEDKLQVFHHRVEALSVWEKKTEAERNRKYIAVGDALWDLRDAVEAGEVGELADWWSWFEDNIRAISRRTAERYMELTRVRASAEAKVIDFRAKETERKQAYQSKKVPSPPRASQVEPEPPKPVVRISAPPKRYPDLPDDDRLIATAMDAIRKLSWNGLVRLYKEIIDLYHLWQREGREQ